MAKAPRCVLTSFALLTITSLPPDTQWCCVCYICPLSPHFEHFFIKKLIWLLNQGRLNVLSFKDWCHKNKRHLKINKQKGRGGGAGGGRVHNISCVLCHRNQLFRFFFFGAWPQPSWRLFPGSSQRKGDDKLTLHFETAVNHSSVHLHTFLVLLWWIVYASWMYPEFAFSCCWLTSTKQSTFAPNY